MSSSPSVAEPPPVQLPDPGIQNVIKPSFLFEGCALA